MSLHVYDWLSFRLHDRTYALINVWYNVTIIHAWGDSIFSYAYFQWPYAHIHKCMYLCDFTVCIYMSPCLYACVFVIMPTHIHACILCCKHAWMHACMCVCMHACIHSYMQVCAHICVYDSMYVYMNLCMHAYICLCMHAHIYVSVLCMGPVLDACMNVRMYACMYACICPVFVFETILYERLHTFMHDLVM